jgi:soluble lytic murein transglycosylase-like protein
MHRLQADPSDDFSFSFAQKPSTEINNLMSEQRVAAVLADRLDVFPRSQVSRLARHLLGLCDKYKFDPALILSLINVESRFRIKAVSPVGALGLMQLMPPTAEHVADRNGLRYSGPRSLFDPFTNLAIGVAYLSMLRDKYRGSSPYFHIAAYNIGPGRMDELRARKSFRPTQTKKYYESIRKGVPVIRFYRGSEAAANGTVFRNGA